MEDEEEDEDEVGGTKLMMLVIKTKFMFALYLQFRHLIKICQISLCALLASLEASSWKRKTQTLQPSSVAVFLSGRAFTS